MKKMRLDRKQKGFSLLELIIAVAVLGSLSVMIFTMMNSSSGMYSRTSAESQLQSESQLVANSISDILIDSKNIIDDPTTAVGMLAATYNRVDAYGNNITITPDADPAKFLIVQTINADGSMTTYRVVYDNTRKEVYLITEEPDGGGGTTTTTSLLGEYVSSFDVDLSRYEHESIVSYDMQIEKRGQSYHGDYQVYVRNQELPPTVTVEDPDADPTLNRLTMEPPRIYIDIKNNQLFGRYYKSNPTSSADSYLTFNTGSPQVGYRAFPTGTISHDKITYTWSVDASSDGWASITGSDDTALLDVTNVDFQHAVTSYNVRVSAVGAYTKDGENKTTPAVTANGTINLRMCRSVTVTPNASPNIKDWDDIYKENPYNGHEANEADFYVTYGGGQSISFRAKPELVNVLDQTGVTWKLESRRYDGGDADWSEINDPNIARLMTPTSNLTTNVVQLGKGATNDFAFRITAYSEYDNTVYGSKIFGILPSTRTSSADGAYSRGYRTNISSLYYGERPYPQNDVPTVNEVKFMAVTMVDGVGNSSEADHGASKVKISKDANGEIRLYLDYNAFSYSGDQKKNFYDGNVLVHYVMGYTSNDATKPYCIIGQGLSAYKSQVAAALECSESQLTELQKDCTYSPKPVVTSKVSPTSDIIVLPKGKAKNISVTTKYYNLMEPKGGTYFFGAYLGKNTDNAGDMANNLLKAGAGDVNKDFSVSMMTGYGNADTFVDEGTVTLSAKAGGKYMTDPITLRLTADDYYRIKIGQYADSYTDYKVITANVEGSDVYFPTRESTSTEPGLKFPTSISTQVNGPTTITGLDANGNTITAGIYAQGNYLYINYGSKKYKYSPTSKSWVPTT